MSPGHTSYVDTPHWRWLRAEWRKERRASARYVRRKRAAGRRTL